MVTGMHNFLYDKSYRVNKLIYDVIYLQIKDDRSLFYISKYNQSVIQNSEQTKYFRQKPIKMKTLLCSDNYTQIVKKMLITDIYIYYIAKKCHKCNKIEQYGVKGHTNQ